MFPVFTIKEVARDNTMNLKDFKIIGIVWILTGMMIKLTGKFFVHLKKIKNNQTMETSLGREQFDLKVISKMFGLHKCKYCANIRAPENLHLSQTVRKNNLLLEGKCCLDSSINLDKKDICGRYRRCNAFVQVVFDSSGEIINAGNKIQKVR